jgi:regulatory protein
MEAAAALLAVRSRSIAETRRHLLALGYATGLVNGTVERLIELGYLDDEAFAGAWVEARDRTRPRGALALRRELERRGVAAEAIDAALANRDAAALQERGPGSAGADGALPAATTGGDAAAARAWSRVVDTRDRADRAAARRLLAQRGPSLAREPDPRRRRHKAYALLARNGFDPDVCRDVARAWSEPDTAGDDAAEDQDGP